MSDRLQSMKVLIPTVQRSSSTIIGTLKETFFCHFPGLFIEYEF